MADFPSTDYTIMVSIMCRNEEEVARAMEVMHRVTSGLIMDGISVMFMRFENDER